MSLRVIKTERHGDYIARWFNNGAHIIGADTEHGFRLTYIESTKKRAGAAREALLWMKARFAPLIIHDPVENAEAFWRKMCAEGIVERFEYDPRVEYGSKPLEDLRCKTDNPVAPGNYVRYKGKCYLYDDYSGGDAHGRVTLRSLQDHSTGISVDLKDIRPCSAEDIEGIEYFMKSKNPKPKKCLTCHLSPKEIVALCRLKLGGVEALRTDDYHTDSKTVGSLMKKQYIDKSGLTGKGRDFVKQVEQQFGTLPMFPSELEEK